MHFGERGSGRKDGKVLLVCEWTESESHFAHFQRFGDLDLLGASFLRSLELDQTWDNGLSVLSWVP